MVKKGRLNNTEKYAIQGMVAQDKSLDDICSELDRSEKIISNYINGELTTLLGTIDKARSQAEEAVQPQQKRRRFTDVDEGEIHRIDPEKDDETVVEITISKSILSQTFKQLCQAGLGDRDADRLVNSTARTLAKNGVNVPNSKVLFTECVKRMNAGHFINKKTEGGSSGVAVMSGAASQRMDEFKKTSGKTGSRSARGNIFDPSTGEIK